MSESKQKVMLIHETKKALQKKQKRCKEVEEFHLFIAIEFIQEKDLKKAREWFIELLRVYQKTLETLLDFNDQKEIQEKIKKEI